MRTIMAIMTVMALAVVAGCHTVPTTAGGRMDIQNDAVAALDRAKATDSTLAKHLSDAAGYAVFPTVGKGGLLAGGAWGRGILYEGGKPVGYCSVIQGTVGLQAGGQSYTEIIVFRTKEAVGRFKEGKFTFDAQATAVALRSGAGANAKYSRDVAVFTTDEEGLMAEAAVGGQKFKFEPQ